MKNLLAEPMLERVLVRQVSPRWARNAIQMDRSAACYESHRVDDAELRDAIKRAPENDDGLHIAER